MLRQGASALIEAATDDETVEALDKLAGPRWRLAAQAADVALVAARAAVRGADGKDEDGAEAEVEAGEPAPFRRTVEADDERTNRTKRTTGTKRTRPPERRAVRSRSWFAAESGHR